MPLLGAAIMDTDRMIPNSRSSQNGSSPGSGQSGPTYPSSVQNGPTYHNTSTMPNSSLMNSSGHINSQTGLVVNSVARKKKTERLVPPLIPNHNGLINGSNAGLMGVPTSGSNGGYMNSTSVYSPMMGNNGGLTNHGYTRDTVK